MIKSTLHRLSHIPLNHPRTRTTIPTTTTTTPSQRSLGSHHAVPIPSHSDHQSSPPTHHQPNLTDLEKLRPTRLSTYLPTHHPNWYIDQIQSISNRLNRAFSKQQLIHIVRSILHQHSIDRHHSIVQPTNLKTPQFNLDRSTPKRSLISFILFDHWHLTNPTEIQTHQSFQDLVHSFKQDRQSYPLPYHELFLLYLDHLQAQRLNQTSVIDQLAGTTNVSIELSVDLQRLTIHGRMKDREKFWKQFNLNRRPIYQTKIDLDHQISNDPDLKAFHQLDRQSLTLALKDLSESSGCYLEIMFEGDGHEPNDKIDDQKATLVAYSFDEHNLVERVLQTIKRISTSLTEYDQVPVLIDLNKVNNSKIIETSNKLLPQGLSRNSTSSSDPFAFLPFCYPFKLNWPFHLIFNQSRLARLSSPTTVVSSPTDPHPSAIQSETQVPFDRLSDRYDINQLFSSQFQVLKGFSSSSVRLRDWISDCFATSDHSKTSNQWVECNIYHGHYVKSKNEYSGLVENLIKSDDGATSLEQGQAELFNLLKTLWSNKCNPQHREGRFIFLPASTSHPINANYHKKLLRKTGLEVTSSEVEQNQQSILSPSPDEDPKVNNHRFHGLTLEDEIILDLSIEVYVPIPKTREVRGLHALTKVGSSQFSYHLVKSHHPHSKKPVEVQKVWKERVVILRPYQSTDLMIEVERREEVLIDEDLVNNDEKKPKETEELPDGVNAPGSFSASIVDPEGEESQRISSDELNWIKKRMKIIDDPLKGISNVIDDDDRSDHLILIDRFKSRQILIPQIDDRHPSASKTSKTWSTDRHLQQFSPITKLIVFQSNQHNLPSSHPIQSSNLIHSSFVKVLI